MIIKQFNQSNGKPWGFFVVGHMDVDDVISALNYHIQEQGFLSVSSDYVAHVYAARIEGIAGHSFYNTHVFDENIEGSTPITWVDGNLLEPNGDNETSLNAD